MQAVNLGKKFEWRIPGFWDANATAIEGSLSSRSNSCIEVLVTVRLVTGVLSLSSTELPPSPEIWTLTWVFDPTV